MRFNKVFLVFCLFVSSAFVTGMQDGDLNRIFNSLLRFSKKNHQEKIYLHLDRPLYSAGEEIFFCSYLVDAITLRPDSTSKTLYVALFDSKNRIVNRAMLYSEAGISRGQFHLNDTLPSGSYSIAAYTNLMRNSGDALFFKREFSVVNPHRRVRDSVAKVPGVNLRFFPEGGTFIAGFENRVAFEAMNAHGRPVDAQGEIRDKDNKVITRFQTEHSGMGSFKIFPERGNVYRAIFKSREFELPDVEEDGYSLLVTRVKGKLKISVAADVRSPEASDIFIVVQARGTPVFGGKGHLKKRSFVTYVDENKFPAGVAQITVFDKSLVPQCERLVYIPGKQERLDISITKNKSDYGKRDRVDLDIVAKADDRPISGFFSISIYDALKIESSEKFPTTIVSSLMLTSDLRGTIQDPSYYLKDTLPETRRHLDLLLMTHGWRRYLWKDVLDDTKQFNLYKAETGIPIQGQATKTRIHGRSRGNQLTILSSLGDVLILPTDSLGGFYSDQLFHYDTADLVIETRNMKGNATDIGLDVAKQKWLTIPIEYRVDPPRNTASFSDQSRILKEVSESLKMKGVTLLKDVVIKSTRIDDVEPRMPIYGKPDVSISSSKLIDGYPNVLEALKGQIAGVNISNASRIPGVSVGPNNNNNPVVTIRNLPAALLYDGIQVDVDFMMTVHKNDIGRIDVIKTGGFGGRSSGGIIAFYSKTSKDREYVPDVGISRIKYPGYTKAKEFYSPDHSVSHASDSVPDIRNTLYWNPAIRTDADGKAHVSFWTSDILSDFLITIEGISVTGIPGSKTAVLRIH